LAATAVLSFFLGDSTQASIIFAILPELTRAHASPLTSVGVAHPQIEPAPGRGGLVRYLRVVVLGWSSAVPEPTRTRRRIRWRAAPPTD
jgi:hypothetical protein